MGNAFEENTPTGHRRVDGSAEGKGGNGEREKGKEGAMLIKTIKWDRGCNKKSTPEGGKVLSDGTHGTHR